ncbi:MAG TPA: hypothetical protein VGB46_02585 [Flavisolibacter sp.]|jgi:hypothetical protein
MHTIHSGFSFAAPVEGDKANIIKGMLKSADKDAKLPFGQSPSTLFVSIVVVPSQRYQKEELPETLLLLTSYSGPLKTHLDELVAYCGKGLDELFQNCKGYPGTGNAPDEVLKNYLLKHRLPDTFYSGMHGITSTDVEREEKLRKEIKRYIDGEQEKGTFKGLEAGAIRGLIQQHIRSKGNEYAWAHTPCKRTFHDFWKLYLNAILFLLVLGFFVSSAILYLLFPNPFFGTAAIMFITFLVLAAIGIWYIESGKDIVAKRVPDEKMRIIAATQTNPVVNEMTAAGPLKNGWVRRMIFITVLRVVSWARGLINIPTICTARWIAADNGKRLVFISNFTNKSDSYVRDFIDSKSSARGINIMFGHGIGYPKTRMLAWGGNIDDPDGFMNVLHTNQYATEFWYAPHKNLTVDILRNNRKIRNGLFGDMPPRESQEWLNLL